MKIFVAGGSGRVATELIKNLVATGHQVIAGARSPQNIVTLSGVTPVKLDLAVATPEEIAKLMGMRPVYTLLLVHVVKIYYKSMPLEQSK